MKTKRQKSQVLRQILLLMTAQSLAIASMIWGGSLTVNAQEPAVMVEHQLASTSSCQDAEINQHIQTQAVASKKKPANTKLVDFSIGMPWG